MVKKKKKNQNNYNYNNNNNMNNKKRIKQLHFESLICFVKLNSIEKIYLSKYFFVYQYDDVDK